MCCMQMTLVYIYITGSDINALFSLNIELAAILEGLNANKLTLNVDRQNILMLFQWRIQGGGWGLGPRPLEMLKV